MQNVIFISSSSRHCFLFRDFLFLLFSFRDFLFYVVSFCAGPRHQRGGRSAGSKGQRTHPNHPTGSPGSRSRATGCLGSGFRFRIGRGLGSGLPTPRCVYRFRSIPSVGIRAGFGGLVPGPRGRGGEPPTNNWGGRLASAGPIPSCVSGCGRSETGRPFFPGVVLPFCFRRCFASGVLLGARPARKRFWTAGRRPGLAAGPVVRNRQRPGRRHTNEPFGCLVSGPAPLRYRRPRER